MNGSEILFIMCMLVCVGVFLLKLYNIFNTGDVLSIQWVFLSFIIFWISFGVAFALMMVNVGELFYVVLFDWIRVGSYFMWLLLVAEIFFIWRQIAIKPAQPFQSLQDRPPPKMY